MSPRIARGGMRSAPNAIRPLFASLAVRTVLAIGVAYLVGCACWVPFFGSSPEFRQATLDSLAALKGAVPNSYEELKKSPPDTTAMTLLRQRTFALLSSEESRDCNGGVVESLREASHWLTESQQVALERRNPTLIDQDMARASSLFDAATRGENKKK
jgi:hypothetical protein